MEYTNTHLQVTQRRNWPKRSTIGRALIVFILFGLFPRMAKGTNPVVQTKWYRIKNQALFGAKSLQINFPNNPTGLVIDKNTDIDQQLWAFTVDDYSNYVRIHNKALQYTDEIFAGHFNIGFSTKYNSRGLSYPIKPTVDWGIPILEGYNYDKWILRQTEIKDVYEIVAKGGGGGKLYARPNGEVWVGKESDVEARNWGLWKIEEVGPRNTISGNGISMTIPRLTGEDKVAMSEAGPIGNHYLRSQGELRGVLLFAQFKDMQGISLDDGGNPYSNNVINTAKAHGFFERETNGDTEVWFTSLDDKWVTLSKNAREYEGAFGDYNRHVSFINEVVSLYPDQDFSRFDFFVIVTPHSGDILKGSASITVEAGQKFYQKSDGGSIRSAITLGSDIYEKNYSHKILIHEIGHLLGLPNLYPRTIPNDGKSGADHSEAGPWGLMSDATRARTYLQWHKHILNWNDRLKPGPNQRNYYVSEGLHHIRLSNQGYNMIAIPVDDQTRPSKIIVVQPAPLIDPESTTQTIRGGTGLLAYTVDAKISTGDNPIVVLCPDNVGQRDCDKIDPEFGRRTSAVIHPGHELTYQEGNLHIRIALKYKVFLYPYDFIEDKYSFKGYEVEVEVTKGVHEDLRKRQDFSTFEHGGLIWMAEDLTLEVPGSICYEADEENCETYGRMYTWEQAKKACSQLGGGWRLPSDNDWLRLTRDYGGAYGDIGDKDGKSAYSALAVGGISGFDGGFGGKRYYFMDSRSFSFYDFGRIGYYWSSDAISKNEVRSYTFRSTDTMILRESITPLSYTSCRCVRDN